MMAIGCVENIVQAPIIVYGCGRSGTSILQKAIGAHKEVINAGKEDPLLSHLAVFYQAYCGRDREYRSANYRGGLKGLGTSLAQMVFENEFGVGFHVEEEIKRWVTKSFPHMSNIHGLKDMFPQMDIVFIYRNAADVCESALRYPGFADLSFKDICHRWAIWVDEFDAIRAVFSGPVVRYEELKEEPGIVLSRVVNELGLKEDSGPEMAVREGVINSSFSAENGESRRGDSLDWTSEMRSIFLETCGKGLEALGYQMPVWGGDSQ